MRKVKNIIILLLLYYNIIPVCSFGSTLDIPMLRIPVNTNEILTRLEAGMEKILGQDFNKPVEEMSFQELVWWYKAFMFSARIPLVESPEKEKVQDLLMQKFKIKKNKAGAKSFFMWAKRIFSKEYDVPIAEE